MVGARKAGRPVHIAYSTLPRLNRSARWSSGSPAACSGDMYSGVPAMRPRLRQAGVVGGAGQAEVGELDALHAVLQQDVGRLDVAVDQPLRVRRRQAAGDLEADAQDLLDLQRPAAADEGFEVAGRR